MPTFIADFDQFWKCYPLRVGKIAALKAYTKARKEASAEDILAGVERYRVAKPAWQAWAHPSSWLNAGRWLDEASEPQPERRKTLRETYDLDHWTCPHDPHCGHPSRCAVLKDLEEYKRRKAAS